VPGAQASGSPGEPDVKAFNKCPQCGLFEDLRTKCSCGYDATTAVAPGATAKPRLVKRVIAVLLVIPIAVCTVVVIKSQDFGIGLVPAILVGAVGFGLLGLANYLWTGKTADERGG